MRNEGDADKLVFALYLNQEVRFSYVLENSTLNFGNLNISRFSEDSAFTDVQADLSGDTWKVPVTAPALGGVAIAESSKVGLLSTTQGRLVVPSKVFRAVYGPICDSGDYSCATIDNKIEWRCSSSPSFDDLTFSIGGVQVTFTWEEYIRRVAKDCSLLLEEGDNWVLGTSFLTKYYTVFDLEQGRVGFAAAKHETETSGWFILIMIVVFVLLIAFVSAMVYADQQKKKAAQEQAMSQPLLGQEAK
jgi:hypothetical protein